MSVATDDVMKHIWTPHFYFGFGIAVNVIYLLYVSPRQNE